MEEKKTEDYSGDAELERLRQELESSRHQVGELQQRTQRIDRLESLELEKARAAAKKAKEEGDFEAYDEAHRTIMQFNSPNKANIASDKSLKDQIFDEVSGIPWFEGHPGMTKYFGKELNDIVSSAEADPLEPRMAILMAKRRTEAKFDYGGHGDKERLRAPSRISGKRLDSRQSAGQMKAPEIEKNARGLHRDVLSYLQNVGGEDLVQRYNESLKR